MDWRLMTRGEIAGIVLLIGLVGALLFVYAELPDSMWQANGAFGPGFGPGWECTNAGAASTVCLKKPVPKTENPN
jgi:hypothetical protein